MHLSNPKLIKKASSQKKHVHIQFDGSNDMQTEQQWQQTLTQEKLKRQNKLVQELKSQITQKKSKQHSYHFEEHQPFKNKNLIQVQTRKPTIFHSSEQEALIVNKSTRYSQEEEQKFQNKTIEFLKELLFHPNRKNSILLNVQIINKWILDLSATNKLKSFLMLYMILYKFDDIGFKFHKVTYFETLPLTKKISIEMNKIQFQEHLKRTDQYKLFRENQQRKYLANYLQWLIWTNQKNISKEQGDIQFWALAFNNCQRLAFQLLNNKNAIQRTNNVFIAHFLLNAEDFIFRQTSTIPIQEKNIIFMRKEELLYLPKCHWLLGLNISVRYFYRKQFNERVKMSLSFQDIQEEEIEQFYHEYQLLSNYFWKQSIESRKNNNQNVGDDVLEWIASQSDCRDKSINKNSQKNQELVRTICKYLLQKAVKNPKQTKQQLLITLQLLQRQRFLELKQKQNILSSILYRNQKIASKLHRHFSQAIDSLEHVHQTILPQLFQHLATQYNSNYKHRLLSEQSQIKDDYLTQLKHLTKIQLKYRDNQIQKRIHQIITSFNILSHWNKNILKSVLKLLQTYEEKIFKSIPQKQHIENQIKGQIKGQIKDQMKDQKEDQMKDERKGQKEKNKQNDQQLENELKQIQSLNIFLKTHLKLELFTMENLHRLVNFFNQYEQTKNILQFEPRTIFFIKKDILSILFNKNEFNQATLTQIKKQYIEGNNVQRRHNKEQMNEQKQNKQGISYPNSTFTLEELLKLSSGIPYFYDQVLLLKAQAEQALNQNV